MFWVFQICLSLLKKGGVLNLPDNLQFWQIAQSFLRERERKIETERDREREGEREK